ncbi:glycosyltransferase family 2 protein, partial [uncultured Desulfovibrio sp.]
MKYCAVCLIAKDEEYYLKEWCEYHLRIGFDSIIIYDNGSKIPIKKFLKI